MSVNVTIHRGEIRQLKRFVEQNSTKRPVEGLLFGLWTHSFQPVIQFVTGVPDRKGQSVDDLAQYMLASHSLVILGRWTTDEKNTNFDKSKRELRLIIKQGEKNLQIKSLFYDDETKKIEQGRIDKLPGDSAFRLFTPLTDQMRNCFGYDVGPLKARRGEEEDDDADSTTEQLQVKEEQWYSTDEGMKLFGLIFNTTKQNGFEVVETSRDVDSHDIRLTLRLQSREMRLEFPVDFPKSEVNVVFGDGNQKPMGLRDWASHEDLAQKLCRALKDFLSVGQRGSNNKGGAKGRGAGNQGEAAERGGGNGGGRGSGNQGGNRTVAGGGGNGGGRGSGNQGGNRTMAGGGGNGGGRGSGNQGRNGTTERGGANGGGRSGKTSYV